MDKKPNLEWGISEKQGDAFELDELYWFVERKALTETRGNVYLMTMIGRIPRQIIVFQVARDKSAERIQEIVDGAPPAKNYCTDGYIAYCDVRYPGLHIRNVRNKKDTHNVESINADLRQYIPVLRRRSRCFCRSIETLDAVISVFADAYNRFGEAKLTCRVPTVHNSQNHAMHLHKFRELGFSVLDFL